MTSPSMPFLHRFAPAVLIVCFMSTASFVFSQTGPDLILYNGKIFTSGPKQPLFEAIAISSDRIQAVGSNVEIRKLATERTRLIDLQGRTVVPGFNDAHAHFGPMFQGKQLDFKSPEPSWEEAAAAIKAAAAAGAKGEWILGTVGEAVINDQTADRAELDRLAPDHPVLLSTYFGHGAVFNSAAMKAFNIRESQPDPVGGRFERDASSKKLTGRMFEYANWHYQRILAEQGSDEQLIALLKEYATEAASHGITSTQIMSGISTERFVRLVSRANLPIRVRVIAFSDTTSGGRDLSDIQALSRFRSNNNSNVAASGIKWILDGTPIERGAAMRAAYLDKPAVK